MARKKKAGGGGPGSGDWLNTYADMVTLLLTFFILLFSMSSLDAAKFNMLVKAFASEGESDEKIIIRGEASGDRQDAAHEGGESAQDIESIEDIFLALQKMIEENDMQGSMEVSQGEGYVFVRFMDDMLFEPNSARLRAEHQDLIDFVGSAIKSVQTDAKSISIVGHTAAIPGQPEYAVSDRVLSTDRANTILMRFEDVIGVDPQKMFATGYGKWMPIDATVSLDDANRTEEDRAKNRRVEILISSEGASLSDQLENVYEQLME